MSSSKSSICFTMFRPHYFVYRVSHSFPTLLSSDLSGRGRRHPADQDGGGHHDRQGHRAVRRGGAALRRRTARSEEHTSELQSRPHLVCRLLIEKNKD